MDAARSHTHRMSFSTDLKRSSVVERPTRAITSFICNATQRRRGHGHAAVPCHAARHDALRCRTCSSCRFSQYRIFGMSYFRNDSRRRRYSVNGRLKPPSATKRHARRFANGRSRVAHEPRERTLGKIASSEVKQARDERDGLGATPETHHRHVRTPWQRNAGTNTARSRTWHRRRRAAPC